MITATSLRPPAVAGMFYPGEAQALRDELATCLAGAVPRMGVQGMQSSPAPTYPGGMLKALIVPHAGYVYSGGTAGQAYARLAPLAARIRRVVLLGPCHRVAVNGIAAPTVQAFATPLGDIPLDRKILDELAALPQIVASDDAHAREHSLEVQLPFLQTLLDDYLLVPLAVGRTGANEVAQVIDRLWGGPETLILISSDLSHFHGYADAQRIDGDTADRILALEQLTSFEQACGALPINGLLAIARQRGLRIERIAQCNSGDTAGDRSRVVGYASFALYEPPRSDPAEAADPGPALLARARNAIAAEFNLPPLPEPAHPGLEQPGATFVTLTQDGRLRGSIGSLQAHRTLDQDVRANAVAAALRDPRFPPLTAEELAGTRVEVSLLTVPTAMQFADEADALRQLRPNVDGLIFAAGGRRSTFLPQVWEQLPGPKQFMAHLKQKAGLPADYWGPEVRLQRYEVRKWKEPMPR